MNIKKEGYFNFDPDDKIYEDHFPGQPVVPGNLIIDAFIISGREIKNFISIKSVKNFKFKKFLTPGVYYYEIYFNEDFFDCFIFENDKKIVTGKIYL